MSARIALIALATACAPQPMDAESKGTVLWTPEDPPSSPTETVPTAGPAQRTLCASSMDGDHKRWLVTEEAGWVTVEYGRPFGHSHTPREEPLLVWDGPGEDDTYGLLADINKAAIDAEGPFRSVLLLPSGAAPVELVCWDEGLAERIGHEPIEGFDSTLADGCPAPRNELPVEFLRETGAARCALVTGKLNGDDLSYPQLEGWDLRGARFFAAELLFAQLVGARLEGADLTGLLFGYAEIDGSADENTITVDGCEETPGDTVFCRR